MADSPVLNCFNFFCHFCLNNTVWENRGNHAKCLGCARFGSNYVDKCETCNLEAYLFDNNCVKCAGAYEPTNKEPEQRNCPTCKGETTWSCFIGAFQC